LLMYKNWYLVPIKSYIRRRWLWSLRDREEMVTITDW
jgi:hypothetical protein